MEDRRKRIENALWGLFAGDALAMPAHWFYSLKNLRETFDGGLTGYQAPPHPHPESFMVGMGYRPDVARAGELGRPYDILHEQRKYYETTYSELKIATGEREGQHGNATPKPEDRYHYHHGLAAGENTLGAQLVRVLMRSVIAAGRYDEAAFLDAFVAFMTTPGGRKDPYCEIYLRLWFENFSRGLPVESCAARQRDVWSVGSHGGMIRPMVLSMMAATPYQALGFAIEHQNLTHRSENIAAALGVTVPLLQDLLAGADPRRAVVARSAGVREPAVSGHELFKLYRDHQGPGNIPDERMWRLHVGLKDQPFDLAEVAALPEERVVLERYATACYPEHGLPLLLFFAVRHRFDPEAALLADANAGGDNVHRAMVLGLIVGAACETFPQGLQQGLRDSEALAGEIRAFAEIAAAGNRW